MTLADVFLTTLSVANGLALVWLTAGYVRRGRQIEQLCAELDAKRADAEAM